MHRIFTSNPFCGFILSNIIGHISLLVNLDNGIVLYDADEKLTGYLHIRFITGAIVCPLVATSTRDRL
ncbi:hypothetical protein KC19_VG099500 [Ceratodon purpureus]|uniref:Uncharacterized protein n=1 Tax=Ceratodon purpureus TaxID=3225 RepID=A0A8T0HNW8_CERPU|nr:hypothetical protein KC19_VG099500 [Ceratodon purpureus]